MTKLLIADDERIIRETISHLIDWDSLGITLTGLAKDGNEAYDIILDESPDIVLTDIKMPGLSGLDLIRKTHEINHDTLFLILSGYSEFEYAKQAMEYGVRHYILKPCNEEQIIAGIREVMEELSERRAFQKIADERRQLLSNMHTILFSNMINDSLLAEQSEARDRYHSIFEKYRRFLDMDASPYEIYYIYYLEKENLEQALERIEAFRTVHSPGIHYSYIYVQNTLIFFFSSYRSDYPGLDALTESLSFPRQAVQTSCRHQSCRNLRLLLDSLLKRLCRYETIYYSDGNALTTICNYKNIICEVDSCARALFGEDREESDKALAGLVHILSMVTDLNLMRQLISSVIILATSKSLLFDSVSATEFIVKMERLNDGREILALFSSQLSQIRNSFYSGNMRGELSAKIQDYIGEHLSDCRLSLKWISENVLFMNEDYVSKKFFRETGEKFSKYLTDTRIKKAKELLAHADTDKILNVAELVGYGNNPQYFSQIFKKNTGLTPTNYSKIIRGNQ